jgi:hypothetical protein
MYIAACFCRAVVVLKKLHRRMPLIAIPVAIYFALLLSVALRLSVFPVYPCSHNVFYAQYARQCVSPMLGLRACDALNAIFC